LKCPITDWAAPLYPESRLSSAIDLHETLRRYWGYEQFRPKQEAVIRSLLAGRDVAVIMPTGGGKSLCYQMPAVVAESTAVVISPLIALMADQAAQLAQMGIPAAFLNSSLSGAEQNDIMRKARAGAYRLLYLSPERLVREDTIGWLRGVPVGFFAIDEAHCISEWGHEFRPEYRQLRLLREAFPDKPIAAFTASATHRVRHDIIAQLALHEPDKYISSFHRSNLRYIVRQTDTKTQPRLLLAALRAHQGQSVIVYAPTIQRVEDTADWLCEKGIAAIPYHAKMGAQARRSNQERWMADEVRVLVGTIAFGLGINKPAVRAVIHLSLPKSLEQYYQEAGRAGRDGLPADCLLLWRKKDAGLLAHFIGDIEDLNERQRAWDRYRTIRNFVESAACRHRQICLHFGETPKWETCGMCDVCAGELECLKMKPVEVPQAALRSMPSAAVGAPGRDSAASDPQLFAYLREWRNEAARREKMPAYIILHDASLEDLCRKRPVTYGQLLLVSGIGERKAERYGQEILQVLDAFRKGARAAELEERGPSPAEHTKHLLREGRTFDEIAQIRGRRVQTIVDHVAQLVERGEVDFDTAWVLPERRAAIEEAASRLGVERMKPIKDAVEEQVSYDEIRLVLAAMRRRAGAVAVEVQTAP
jgi:ATP-dependent DNA helicase RecQ